MSSNSAKEAQERYDKNITLFPFKDDEKQPKNKLGISKVHRILHEKLIANAPFTLVLSTLNYKYPTRDIDYTVFATAKLLEEDPQFTLISSKIRIRKFLPFSGPLMPTSITYETGSVSLTLPFGEEDDVEKWKEKQLKPQSWQAMMSEVAIEDSTGQSSLHPALTFRLNPDSSGWQVTDHRQKPDAPGHQMPIKEFNILDQSGYYFTIERLGNAYCLNRVNTDTNQFYRLEFPESLDPQELYAMMDSERWEAAFTRWPVNIENLKIGNAL